MRKLVFVLAAVAATALVGVQSSSAQTSRGAATIPAATKNFTPIEKAACGPHRGAHCGWYHHWVCNPFGRCWCAPC